MKAIFAGSFDPPTWGHVDIISRGSGMFEELRVVLAKNIRKEAIFSPEERQKMLRHLISDLGLANVVVDLCDGLLADYAVEHSCKVLLRSVRTSVEIPYEQGMATMNQRLQPSLETIVMFSKPELQDISSSTVRELLAWRRLPPGIVPELVQKELEKRYGPLLQQT
ncbi:MAG: pantetheine-phosphate adenylyltransferase [Spirochaetes bacterium]|nr:pantetheine-phosphate adenylyltransferase [Spirochaetota bacterium]